MCLTATEQCDWPENSLCQFDPDAVKAKVLTEKNYLYLTFDDGPNEGTDFVIDALADYDVRATFFINRWGDFENIIKISISYKLYLSQKGVRLRGWVLGYYWI